MSTHTSKAVLVTGCSTGIGRATAARLARAGYPVYATARRPDSIGDLAEAGCTILALDVCDEDSMRAAVREVESREGAVGVLINNAGYGSEGAVEEVPMDEVRRQFETNVFGLARMAQLVLPAMRAQRWGRILNLSSMGGRMTLPGGGFYHATKYAVEALSDALRFEVAGFGIAVVLIEPGVIRTKFGDTAIAKIGALSRPGSAYEKFHQRLAASIEDANTGSMAKLAGDPDDVAKVIERAVKSDSPKPRYLITAGAKVFVGMRSLLGARGFDAFLRTQFESPGR